MSPLSSLLTAPTPTMAYPPITSRSDPEYVDLVLVSVGVGMLRTALIVCGIVIPILCFTNGITISMLIKAENRAGRRASDEEAGVGAGAVEMEEIGLAEARATIAELRSERTHLLHRYNEARMREEACRGGMPNAHTGPFMMEHPPVMSGALRVAAGRARPSQPASPAPGARAVPAERSIFPTEPKAKKPKGWWGKLAGNMVGAFAGSGPKPKDRSAKQHDVPKEPERKTGGPDDDAFGIVSDSELSEHDEPPKGYVPHGTVPKLMDTRSGVEMNGPDPRLLQFHQASLCNVEDLDRDSVAGSGSIRSRRASGLRSGASPAHSLASEAAPMAKVPEGEDEDEQDEFSGANLSEEDGPVQPKETL